MGVHSESIFPFMEYFFFSRKLFLLDSLSLAYRESVSLDTFGKPTVGVFLKITSPSWIILSISLDELINSIDWLLRADDELLEIIFLLLLWKNLIWQKILEVFWKICLNIIFWILLWMSTSLVIWNLNITVSTTLK